MLLRWDTLDMSCGMTLRSGKGQDREEREDRAEVEAVTAPLGPPAVPGVGFGTALGTG